jgi:hypothetical protein
METQDLLPCSHKATTWPYPRGKWIQFTNSNPLSSRSIPVSFSHVRLGCPGGLFLSDFHSKNVYILSRDGVSDCRRGLGG